jgi:hypothetical protein
MADITAIAPGHELCKACKQFAHDINTYKFQLDDTPELSSWVRRGFTKNPHAVFQHLDTFEELRTSAQTCRLCRLFLDDFGDGPDTRSPNLLSHLALYATFLHSPCAFVATWMSSKHNFWYKGQWEPHEFRIVQNRPYDSSLAGGLRDYEIKGRRLIFDRAVPENAQCRDTFDTARHWLKNCTETHSSCSRRPSQLPTRVVDIGVGSHDIPRVHISNGETTPYVALSHCWGGNIPCKTTNALLQDYTSTGLPVDRFPQNFLDAISVTRELGFRYVW